MNEQQASGRLRGWMVPHRDRLRQVTVLLLFVFATLTLSRLWGQSTELLAPPDFSNFEWRRGISTRADAGFFVPYTEENWRIARGAAKARFAASGWRDVEKVQRDDTWIRVTVSGSALEPTGDGPPNTIAVVSWGVASLNFAVTIGLWIVGAALCLALTAQLLASGLRSRIIFSLSFLGVIGFPLLNSWGDWVPAPEIVENRTLAAEPTFSLAAPEQFASQYNKYFNDHFSLRNNLVKFNAWVKWHVFRCSPLEALIVGKNREIFYHSDVLEKNHSIANFRRRAPFNEQRLTNIWSTLQRFRQHLRARNIGFTVLITPDKPNVYPQLMPQSFTVADGPSIIDQILRVPPEYEGLQILDVREPLLVASRRHRIYFRYGTHWNEYGALIGYLQFHAELRKNHPQLVSLSETDFGVGKRRTAEDNMLNWVGLHTEMSTIEPVVSLPARPAPQLLLPKLLLIHDSFYEKMMPYLHLSFERVVLLPHGGGAFPFDSAAAAVERELPTHVMLEVTERFVEFMFR